MNLADELALIRQHVRRIEADLALARQQLADLEKRLPAAAFVPVSVPPPPPLSTAPVAPSPPPPAAPPPLPPPLPVPVTTAPPSPPLREFGPAAPAEDGVSPWREWLTALQLWPPAGEGDAEVRLGAWWATRIGAALAVIGVVLFGVYVSVNTPPWVKFAELVAVSAGLTGAGRWWERRTPRFGAVVFSAGLALLYFCAFAGYALPPVKVIAGVVPAALWQLAAVGGLVATAVLRRSPGIATMAVGFGYLTAIFARFGGLDELALAMAGLLAAAAVGLHRRLGWEAPSVLALPGSYAVLATVWLGSWRPAGLADPWWAWGSLLGFALLFFVRDWRPRAPAAAVSAGERWFQGANTGLALVLGTALGLSVLRAQLAGFFLGAAALLAVLGELRRRQGADAAMAPVFFAQAAGSLALGVVELAEGRTVALALLAQAWVVYLISGYLRSRVLAATALLTVAAAWFFQVTGGRAPVEAGSVSALGSVLFAAGFAWLTAAMIRRFAGPTEGRWLAVFAGFATFCAAGLAVVEWEPRSWLPVWTLTVAGVLGAVALGARSLGAVLASAGLVAMAHLLIVIGSVSGGPHPDHLPNAAVVLGTSALLGWWLGSASVARLAEAQALLFRRAGDALWGVAVVSLAAVLFGRYKPWIALTALYGVALAWAGVATVAPARRAVWLSVWTVALAVVWWAGRLTWPIDRLGFASAVLAAWALPFATRLWPRFREAIGQESGARFVEPLLTAAAAWVTFRLLPWLVEPDHRLELFAGAATLLFAASLRTGLRSGLASSWLVWVMTWLAASNDVFAAQGASSTLPYVAAGLMAWVPALLLARAPREEAPLAWWTSHGANVQTAIATVTCAWLALAGWREAYEVLALLVAAAVAWGCRRVAPLEAAGAAVAFLLGLAWLRAAALALGGDAEGPGAAWAIALLACVALAALPWLVADPQGALPRERRHALGWIAGAAALGLAFLIALVQRGALAPYATVGWGLAAISLFVAGLFVRLRPFRLLGLAGLLVCIPRVFLVDLQSAFHRIVAFVVLGGVLLWVGFSYHRFRHLIVDTKEES